MKIVAKENSRKPYTKSVKTKQKILIAALGLFGDKGFEAVGTREIAELAGVNQPAIHYHFKGKEQLYLACADFIIEKFMNHARQWAVDLSFLREENPNAEQGRQALKIIIVEMIAFYLQPSSAHWISFVHREIWNPEIAHDRLYTHIWSPGIKLITRLVNVIRGEDTPQNQLEAMTLISSLSSFRSGILVTKKSMNWKKIEEAEFNMIKNLYEKKIDCL